MSYYFDPVTILDTSNASGVGSGGSLTVGGGLSVGQDTYIGGNLSISGTTTSFADNIIVVNENPSNSADTGILFQRFASDVSNNNNYAGIIYSEPLDTFLLGYVQNDTQRTNASISNFIPLRISNLNAPNDSNTLGNIFTTNGNVGIGNMFPTSALHIVGPSQNAPNSKGIMLGEDDNTYQSIQLNSTVGSYIDFSSPNVDYLGRIMFSNNSNKIAFFINGDERASIGSTGTLHTTSAVVSGGSLIAVHNANTLGSLVTTHGNVGIGIPTPNYTLDINGNINASNSATFSFNSNTFGNIFTTGGNVGIDIVDPDHKFHVHGNICATGSVIGVSDKKIKTNVKTILHALDKVNQMRGVSYINILTNKNSIGVIAQEMETIVPEVVETSGDLKGVAYGNITAILIEAIKELSFENKLLKTKIDILEAKLENS